MCKRKEKKNKKDKKLVEIVKVLMGWLIKSLKKGEKEMIKRMDVHKVTERELEDRALTKWVFDSHYWSEYKAYPGYFTCEWCGFHHTSIQGINKEFSLCKGNPILKKLHENISMGTTSVSNW